MVEVSEIKALLKNIGFSLEEGSENTWIKSYPNHNGYKLKVDFDKSSIDYGKQIIVAGKTTSNLKAAENLVVLECVNRLLEKGYKPKNIHLEKTWATGHGTSGRLDILITHDNGSAYLMIECKTHGGEFEKEFKRILKDGGQLFTYFQQDKNADVLMLYSSSLEKGKIHYRNEIIRIEDDYRQTGNVKDFYDRWSKLPKNNGVFDSWVKAYDFQSKALTPKNLKDIKQEDSGFIFNQFLEILRHNVVSDKPNAFNKIFTLFLCKIYDEKATKPNDELAFQWFYTPYVYEGISYPPDDNVSFQKRLTDLYRKGMKEFLDKSVTDISDAEFEKKYGKLDAVTKRQILDEFTEIRLKKNNEFAIKEVFNDDSFEENAKVVKEVVELLQGYKIRYTKKQQYLSDFFELLLTTGLKQESGQFFTPVPIAQFIIKSIPLDKIVAEKLEKGEKDNLLPTIIDYAAGSGHFITESMHEVQRIIDKTNPQDFIDGTAKKISGWKTDHFDWAYQYIYGIEKDYRLVKVGKVGCYLHGDGLAQIIHSDGLGNFSKTEEYKGLLKKSNKDFPRENNQFDIVISNPPYSVSAFRNNARKYYTENDFEIYHNLSDQSSEIECLFIERTKQLLKDGGIAGIILPSSILNNGGIYTKAREIILKYFEIIGIAELGSNTFMATGTNTVTLFLRRRNNYDVNNINELVRKAVEDKKDLSINGIEKPITKYVSQVWQGLTVKDYFTLLSGNPNQTVKESEIFIGYSKKFKEKEGSEFYRLVIELESEKIFYYVLIYSQKIVLINSGEKNEEKEFLGYEFSNRRGSEGIHPIQRGKSIDECTHLFDPEIFENPKKASTYIYQAFLGNFNSPINQELEKNITRISLVESVKFDGSDFDKTISLSFKKKVNFDSKWTSLRLGEICELYQPQTITSQQIKSQGKYKVYGANGVIGFYEKFNHEYPEIAVTCRGATCGTINFTEAKSWITGNSMVVKPKADEYNQKYLFYILEYADLSETITGTAQPQITRTSLSPFKIPIPTKKIQEKIVFEIEAIERKKTSMANEVSILEKSISSKFVSSGLNEKKLVDIASFKNGLNFSRNSTGELMKIIGVKDFQSRFVPDLDKLDSIQIDGKLNEEYELQPNDLLVVRSNGSANLVGRFLFIEKLFEKTSFSGFTIRIRPDLTQVHAKYLCYYLRTEFVRDKLTKSSKGSNIKSLNQGMLGEVKISLPLLTEQKRAIADIEKIEQRISKLTKSIDEISHQKVEILKKYL